MTQKHPEQSLPSEEATVLPAGLGNNLGKVREILFGAQLRGLETRIDGIEAEMKTGFAQMEELFKRELNSLATCLRENRAFVPFELTLEDKKFRELDEALARLDSQGVNQAKRLGQMEQFSQQLGKSLEAVRTDLDAGLAEERRQLETVRQLCTSKQDRAALVSLFAEMGQQLNRASDGDSH